MYNTSTYGYYYQGPVKSKKSSYTTRIRFTRVILLMVFFTASFLFGAFIQAYASNEEPASTTAISIPFEPAYVSYSVESGDTLWAIAKLHLPEQTDIRAFIHEIKAMNHLESSSLQVGQLLQIPTVY